MLTNFWAAEIPFDMQLPNFEGKCMSGSAMLKGKRS